MASCLQFAHAYARPRYNIEERIYSLSSLDLGLGRVRARFVASGVMAGRKWPDERTSSKHVVSLDSREAWRDDAALDPEALLIAREEGERPPSEPPRALGTWSEVEAFLPRLDPEDRDIATLYWREGLTQSTVGRLVGLTQMGVSYRLSKMRRRLQFLRTIPVLTEEGVERDLSGLGRPDRRLVWHSWRTCSGIGTAEALNAEGVPRPSGRVEALWTQSMTSHRVRYVLKLLRRMREGADLRHALLTTERGLRRARKSRTSSESHPAVEALRTAKERLDEAIASLPRFDPYIEFLRIMCEDKRWGILRVVRYPHFEESKARRVAELRHGVTEDEDG